MGLTYGKSRADPEAEQVAHSRLSTFEGVFTPSILTILGVILYLRLGWVVGNVGLWGTLSIVTLSTLITFLTALSISSIATAQDTKGGGAYYMVSRSLGIEAGGAVGIPLYLAQALSVALYTIGFAESLANVFPALNAKIVALITTALVAALALRSTRTAIRSQYIIMAAIGLSFISLILGGDASESIPVAANLAEVTPVQRENFWVVFAVFFPAVTGIMAGVNMSGDLRSPARSIPTGTLAAVAVGFVIYMLVPFLLSSRATPEQLINDPLIMRRISYWGDAILLGVWGATLSSAVGSILGAPRVLQALAKDRILPSWLNFLGKGVGPTDQPRTGTIVTCGLAMIVVLVGNLNFVAPILTMFFLTTYGVLNIAAGLERFLANPSYRPKFRVHWILSLTGALGCMGVMFLIDPIATAVAGSFVIAIYFWLEHREMKSAWGDVKLGIWMNLTRVGLLRIRRTPDPKNWRPHILVLSGAPTRRWHLIRLASALSHNRALLTVSSILPAASVSSERIRALSSTIYEYLDRHGIQALVRLVPAESPFLGAKRLVEAYGLGMLVPNTIMLGDSQVPGHRAEYCDMIRYFHSAQRNTMIVRLNEERGFGLRKRIDVWWGGQHGNGGLMLILSYLLQTSLRWRGSRVRVKMVVPTKDAAYGAQANISALLAATRINADTEILVADGRSFPDILRQSSTDTDLVFLGMAAPGDNFEEYYESLQKRTSQLPTTVFVLAGENLDFEQVIL